MRLSNLFRAFLENHQGNIAILFAVTLPLVIGGAGLSVETSYWYFRALKLQGATDTAAYAAAIEARAGSSKTAMTSAASAMIAENGFDPTKLKLQVVYPYTMPSGSSGVKVVITVPEERFFSKIISEEAVTITKAAIARFETAASACILALDPAASKSVLFSGNSKLTLTGCNAMANSVATDAIKAQGSTTVTAPCLMASGGVVLTSGVTLTSCAHPTTGLSPAADPFSATKTPLYSNTCTNSKASTLQPGLYCGGLDLKGNVTLDPGVYVIDGGTLKINGNALVKGSGVTFYLTNSATADLNGNAEVDLSAPTSGDYSGMLFFGDPANHDGKNKFNGTAKSTMTGALYFPSQEVDYQGNFSGANGCTQIVANTVEWTGNTAISVDCSAYGMKNIPVTSNIQLAG
jgi:hypothetical protein